MRYLLTSLVCLIAFSVLGQESGLKIDNKSTVYQKTFQGKIDNPIKFTEELKHIDGIRLIDNIIYGEISIPNSEVKKSIYNVGKKPLNTIIFILRTSVKAQIKIEIKDDRYRVTLSEIDLKFIDEYPFEGEVNQLNEYTLNKKGEIRNRTFKEAKLVYDELFERYFILEQEHNQEEQDW
jgi:hypothetical protein